MSKLIPLSGEVLVVDVNQEQTIDGVILPETSKEDVYFSKVVAVGSDVDAVQPGDLIVRGMYSGIPMRLEGVEFRLLRLGECLGKIV